MIKIIDPSECCGCTACASVCPRDAISMKPDVMGFLYPSVDEANCIECGLCEKVCAFNDAYDTSMNLPQPLAYAARHKDIKEVEEIASMELEDHAKDFVKKTVRKSDGESGIILHSKLDSQKKK